MESFASGRVESAQVHREASFTFRTVLRHPATGLFAALYAGGALVYALLGGPDSLIKPLAFLICYTLIIFAVLRCTARAPAPPWAEAAPYTRQQLWWQTGILLLFWLLGIGYSFLLFGPVQALVPRYRALAAVGNVVVLFLLYVGLPVFTMRRFGVSWRELGFGRGYRVWMVMGISCFPPVVALIVQAFLGRALGDIGSRVVNALLLAAFVEEVFYRGLLLTRLIRLVGTGWGIVLAALIFGAAHAAVNLFQDGNLAVALAQLVVAQAAFGIVAAVLFARTRAIWAGVAFHALLDGTGL